MSLIYLKSEQFLKNNDDQILTSGNHLPFQFSNNFKDPIKITPRSQIELISADLNVENEHTINSSNINNCFTHCLGTNNQQFLQKPARIPDGNYTDETLASQVEKVVKQTTNMDNVNFECNVLPTGQFELKIDVNETDSTSDDNVYLKLAEKQGFAEGTTALQTGVGTYLQDYTIKTNNDLTYGNTVVQSGNIKRLSIESGDTQVSNNLKQPNLISNLLTSKSFGVNNANGYVAQVISPPKFRKFDPAGFLTAAGTGKFSFSSNGAVIGGSNALAAYTGANGYDFQYQYGPSNYLYIKIIASSGSFNTFTLPNSTTPKLLPYGHFMLGNSSDTAINSIMSAATHVWMLNTDGAEYYWDFFSAASSGTTASIFKADDAAFIKKESTETSLASPTWGSASLSISRGECGIFETNSGLTNQVSNTNKFTRARVENVIATGAAASLVNNTNNVYADYTIQLTPNKTGTGTYVLMNYGEQVDGKVAGDTDWLDLTSQVPEEKYLLSKIFNELTTATDNLILAATIDQFLCLKFFVGHDTAGDLTFTEMVEIGNTEIGTVGPNSLHLPMLFNESSYPLMPVVGLNNGFLGNAEHQNLVQGIYSEKSINTFNLSSLRAYMNSNWGSNNQVPVRQPKQTITNFCDETDMEDLVLAIEPSGFNGKSALGTFTLPLSKTKKGNPVNPTLNILYRLGTADELDQSLLLGEGYTVLPNQISTLFLNMGFPKIELLGEIEKGKSTQGPNAPIHNRGQNYIINIPNLGNILGQNSGTGSKSQMIATIPSGELSNSTFENDKHYKSSYPVRVNINASGEELINTFQVFITNDDGRAATSLRHPTNLFLKISEM